MAGLQAESGQPLDGWEHVVQSVGKILTTPLRSRVMRRDFGSEIPFLVDAPMTDRVVLAVFAAAANALALWEPRFRLVAARVNGARADGTLALSLAGVWYPRGHLGDMTPAVAPADITVRFVR